MDGFIFSALKASENERSPNLVPRVLSYLLRSERGRVGENPGNKVGGHLDTAH